MTGFWLQPQYKMYFQSGTIFNVGLKDELIWLFEWLFSMLLIASITFTFDRSQNHLRPLTKNNNLKHISLL
jgi:hypothetical protein